MSRLVHTIVAAFSLWLVIVPAVPAAEDPCAAAETAQAAAEFDDAVSLWTRCIANHPEPSARRAEAYHGRGKAHLGGGSLAYAIDDLDRAIEIAPDEARALPFHVTRGIVYQRSGLKDEFFADMKHVITNADDDAMKAHALRLRGDGYIRLNLFAAAITDLNRAIKLDPNDPGSFLLRAQMQQMAGRDVEALEDLDASLRLDADNAQAYLMRAALNYRGGHHRKAIRDTEAALILDASSAEAHAQRCDVLSGLGIAVMALESCRQVARLRPATEAHHVEHALVQWQLGEMEAARAALGFVPGDGAQSVERQMLARFPRLLGERLLANLGFTVGEVDGAVDAHTRSALARFEDEHGAPAAAEFDAATLAHLKTVLHARIRYRDGSDDLHPRRPVLLIKTGPASGRRITLWTIPATLGRAGGQIARIEAEGDGYAMVHVSGDPVPALNGAPMSAARQVLRDGDTLGLFGVEIAYSYPPR